MYDALHGVRGGLQEMDILRWDDVSDSKDFIFLIFPFLLSWITQLQLSPTLLLFYSCFFYCSCILAFEYSQN